ncbi:50S ribosomal protein L25/general stress protein Ctc [Suttonella ornithocola]|uniref:Large ribosomal subunit protein bL25 n=1 Tax=Suttonella ornithocola TaxID=279832 RepID=A0A380MMA8_9GAMM|nr:50S ribosomal protein L25/general stress protein Ctc [Suttonella ornithocola]SUO93765.1 General stress protein CTC [Suttonella ornithocola]
MSKQDYRYTLNAVVRNDEGKGASRRLRREGWVPAIVYGADEQPLSIAIKQDELIKNAKHESFFSQIINLKVEGKEDSEVLVRDVQHHAYKPLFQHFDLQRIVRGQELHATVVLHFINEEEAPGVKAAGVISHNLTSLDIICRPRDIPEYIEVDMGNLEIGDAIRLADIKLPEDVRLAGEWTEEDLEQTVVGQILPPQTEEEDEDEETTVAADEVPATEVDTDDNEEQE